MPDIIDFSPIISDLLHYVILAVGLLLTWAMGEFIRWLRARINLSNTTLDEQLQQQFNEAVLRGMAYAETVSKGALKDRSKLTVENPYVREAAEYVVKFWPDLVKATNLTEAKIRETVLARLPAKKPDDRADEIVEAKAGAAKVK